MGSLDLARTQAACIAPEMIKKVNAGKAAVLARHGRSGMLQGTPTMFAIHHVVMTSFDEALLELKGTYLAAAEAGEDANAVESDFKGWAARLREIVHGIAIDACKAYSPASVVATGSVDGDLRSAETRAVTGFGLAIAGRRGRVETPPSAN